MKYNAEKINYHKLNSICYCLRNVFHGKYNYIYRRSFWKAGAPAIQEMNFLIVALRE